MTPEQTQEILALRIQSLTPKEIARKLGLRPAEVTAIIRSDSEQSAQDRLDRGEMDPIYECVINGTFPDDRFFNAGEKRKSSMAISEDGMGLAIVLVARKSRPGKLMVCSYLVDYYCLGVKNVLGPKQIPESEYLKLKEKVFAGYSHAKVITLEQAQAIVLSSFAYANSLELSPHPDFTEVAKTHLGLWDEKLSIWCGDSSGKPSFIPGPNDFPAKIMGILDRSVGKGNYNFISPIGIG